MRISLCISSLGQGGAERIASIMANYWAKRGEDVSIITLAEQDVRPVYDLDGRVAVHNLGLTGASSNIAEKVCGNVRRVMALRQCIKGTRPDVVVSFMDATNVLILLSTMSLGIPVVATEHCHPVQFPAGRAWSALRKLVYPHAAAIVVLGEEIREWFTRNVTQEGIHIIHNPVMIGPVAKPKKSGGSNTIIAAGRLSEEKRFEMLIEAFSRIAADAPDWNVVIYGEGPDRPMLESLVRDKRLEGRISLPGWVDDLYGRMMDADIFVLPSRTEAFPGALCEAMACGLAVVSFDCPSGPREIIRHNVDGILVPNGDIAGMAAEIKQLMNDETLRNNIGERALQISVRLSLENIMARWDDLFSEVGVEPCV